MAKDDQDGPMVAMIGPIDDTEGNSHWLFAPLTADLTPAQVVTASSPRSGFASVARMSGDSSVFLAPEYEETAAELGLPTRLQTDAEKRLTAEIALGIGRIRGLPASDPPELRRELLQSLAELRRSPVYRLIERGERLQADIWWDDSDMTNTVVATMTGSSEPDADLVFVLQHAGQSDAHIVQLSYSSRPSYAVKSLADAYGFPGVPVFSSEERLIDRKWLNEWGHAIAGFCFCAAVFEPSRQPERLEAPLHTGATVYVDMTLL